MKHIFLLLFGFIIFVMGLYEFMSDDESLPEGVYLEKEVSSLNIRTTTDLETSVISKPVLVKLGNSVSDVISIRNNQSGRNTSIESISRKESSASVVNESIPTPDELWEQQQKENREFDVPATIPDIAVISDEQRELEASSVSIQSETLDSFERLDISSEDQFVGVKLEEVPAVEATMEVIPFELRELEATEKIRVQDSSDEYTEPLVDPGTGLPDFLGDERNE